MKEEKTNGAGVSKRGKDNQFHRRTFRSDKRERQAEIKHPAPGKKKVTATLSGKNGYPIYNHLRGAKGHRLSFLMDRKKGVTPLPLV